ncbi:MAG: hypothetical protein J0H61_14685, partial [Alphaproteobacteria bacterium]|nr:hypothetical protein [Alphaproteobacteria bacterium]
MFAFATPLSASILKTIKTGLANSLPNVKSSHRCEAAARGLGFKSHAALLATLKDSSIIVVQADAARFKSYLSIHQFDVTPEPFYLSVGRVLMMKVLETEPRLTSWGYGIGKRERDLDGKRPTIEEHIQKFTVERNYLLRDSAIQEFLQALAFLSK